MDKDVKSIASSDIEDDWTQEGDFSISSLTNNDESKEASPSLGSELSDVESKKNRWARLLGVANRPNPLDEWDQLYNLNNQSGLRQECRRLAKALDNKKSVPELESFMTLYCKKRNVDYRKDSGWTTVLERLLKFDIPQEHLLNVFFAFTTKYIPKETKETSQIFDLFRLILLYHDPVICSHLDSLKCSPSKYLRGMFSTLMADTLSDEACRKLWDIYIEKGDPFLIFYMAVVLVVNAREALLAINYNERENALKFLLGLTADLTAEDVGDFVQLAAYYADRTPQSIREDFHYLIFGSNYDDEVGDLLVNKLICLPITTPELTRKERSSISNTSLISYFIIDCRSQDAFNCGNLYGSFNLDCQSIVDNPQQFEIALNSLEAYKNDQRFEEHLCLVGYGSEEEDRFMNMVLARFLKDGKSYVSFCKGGFRAIHQSLLETKRLRTLNCHNETKCSECTRDKQKSWNLVGRMKDVVINKSISVKEKVNNLVTSPSAVSPTDIKHVTPSERHGKRYRNEPSVFSIDDEDSSDDDGGAVFTKTKSKDEVKLSELADIIEQFECHEITEDRKMYPSHLALTRTHIHILREVEGKDGMVTTEARHPLSTVVRVTSKKKIPELLSFKFGYEIAGETKVTAIHRFLVPKSGDCAKAVKTAIFALRPLTDPLEE